MNNALEELKKRKAAYDAMIANTVFTPEEEAQAKKEYIENYEYDEIEEDFSRWLGDQA